MSSNYRSRAVASIGQDCSRRVSPRELVLRQFPRTGVPWSSHVDVIAATLVCEVCQRPKPNGLLSYGLCSRADLSQNWHINYDASKGLQNAATELSCGLLQAQVASAMLGVELIVTAVGSLGEWAGNWLNLLIELTLTNRFSREGKENNGTHERQAYPASRLPAGSWRTDRLCLSRRSRRRKP